MLYCISTETIEKFETEHMTYSFPFVLHGIFRYLYSVHRKKQGGEPERVLVSDPYMWLNVVLRDLPCMLIIYGVIRAEAMSEAFRTISS